MCEENFCQCENNRTGYFCTETCLGNECDCIDNYYGKFCEFRCSCTGCRDGKNGDGQCPEDDSSDDSNQEENCESTCTNGYCVGDMCICINGFQGEFCDSCTGECITSSGECRICIPDGESVIKIEDLQVFDNLVINDVQLTIEGDLELNNTVLNLNNGSLEIENCLEISQSSLIVMLNDSASLGSIDIASYQCRNGEFDSVEVFINGKKCNSNPQYGSKNLVILYECPSNNQLGNPILYIIIISGAVLLVISLIVLIVTVKPIREVVLPFRRDKQ